MKVKYEVKNDGRVKLENDEVEILLDAFKPLLGAEAMKANLRAGGYWVIAELDIEITYENGKYYMKV